MTPEELQAFDRLETAVEKHPRLKRALKHPHHEANCHVNRLGYRAEIAVKLRGSNMKALLIHADGESLIDACDKLIAKLDSWACVYAS